MNDSNHTLSPLTARLEALVNGDLTWLNDLDVQPIALVASAWRTSSHPTVTLRAISVVLSGIKQGIWTLEAAHDWAYFVMHGGFPRHKDLDSMAALVEQAGR